MSGSTGGLRSLWFDLLLPLLDDDVPAAADGEVVDEEEEGMASPVSNESMLRSNGLNECCC